MRKILTLLILLQAAPLANLSAQFYSEGKKEITGFAGYMFFKDIDLDSRFIIGGRFQYRFTERYGFEFSMVTNPSSTEGSRRDEDGNLLLLDNARALFFNWNIVYHHYVTRRFDIAGTFGIGGLSIFAEQQDAATDFAFNFGGGFNLTLADEWIMKFGFRDYVSSIGIDFFNIVSGSPSLSPSESRHAIGLTGELAYRF